MSHEVNPNPFRDAAAAITWLQAPIPKSISKDEYNRLAQLAQTFIGSEGTSVDDQNKIKEQMKKYLKAVKEKKDLPDKAKSSNEKVNALFQQHQGSASSSASSAAPASAAAAAAQQNSQVPPWTLQGTHNYYKNSALRTIRIPCLNNITIEWWLYNTRIANTPASRMSPQAFDTLLKELHDIKKKNKDLLSLADINQINTGLHELRITPLPESSAAAAAAVVQQDPQVSHTTRNVPIRCLDNTTIGQWLEKKPQAMSPKAYNLLLSELHELKKQFSPEDKDVINRRLHKLKALLKKEPVQQPGLPKPPSG